MKKNKIILLAFLTITIIFSSLALAYHHQYLDQIGVDFDISPDSDKDMNYLPLQPIAYYYNFSLSYDEKEIHGYWKNIDFKLKIGSRVAEVKGRREIYDDPVIMVNGHILVPRVFLEDLLNIDFKWRKPSSKFIIRKKSYPDDIKIYLYTNKERYEFGEQIVVTMIIKNTGNSRLRIPLSSSQIYDLYLFYKDREIWRWSRDKMFTSAITYFELEPYESKVYTITLPRELILTPAQYQLQGTFTSNPEIKSDIYFFTVVD
ncbi:hypothetical protein BBF96_11545 [Anoxybacter fermentans]|uniref:Copper amine oxidase-like N-terminal domain-containing protein n=1 Tax=Anoxybacter fermentans TaxID=1323375 RepID=A0A3Q9HTA4_9FIRM|nr:BsuPI-related putative proteinase inhibitor [Anoxybacter fermentans]AZR73969.1 hypothetical protein BBF96_11545 [Anoxybacter fermentans]